MGIIGTITTYCGDCGNISSVVTTGDDDHGTGIQTNRIDYTCTCTLIPPLEESLAILKPQVAAQWHPIKNEALQPEHVRPSSLRKVWWLVRDTGCACKFYEWEARVRDRVFRNGEDCPYKASNGKRICPCRSIANLRPKLVAEWHPTKNGNKTPTDFSVHSSFRAWWVCSVC